MVAGEIFDQYSKPEIDEKGNPVLGEADEKGDRRPNQLQVIVYRDGRVEVWRYSSGKGEPTRVSPSKEELAEAKSILGSGEKSRPSPATIKRRTATGEIEEVSVEQATYDRLAKEDVPKPVPKITRRVPG